ncbi:hypothetical protein HG531_013362 [Fusarium graminearum]|nr:hypothetical protein HG531_013362 [Fusarium graminearum]
MRREDLFVLGRDKHGSDAHELETVKLDNLLRQESIDNVDGEEEGLGKQVETRVDFNQPVNQDTTRLPFEVVLVRHILRVGNRLALEVAEVFENFVGVFSNHERVFKILFVQVIDTGRVLEGRVLNFGLLNRDFRLLNLSLFGCL